MMQHTHKSILWKYLFCIALLFFLFLELYGVFQPQLRLCFEAAAELVYLPVYKVSIPFHRYSFLLNKFLLLPAFCLHLPLRTIGALFCLNDLLFYITVAALIIAFTRQYLYAVVVLAAPILIHGVLYYYMVNELFLSGSIMIFLVAIYLHMPDSGTKQILIMLSLFFIIWSHPFTIFMLVLFVISLYTDTDQIKKDRLILLFAWINIIIRLSFISGYDSARINSHFIDLSHLNVMSGLLISDLYASMPGYIAHYWFILLLLVAMFAGSRSGSEKKIAWLAVISLTTVFTARSVLFYQCNWDHCDVSKFMYPVHLFILLYGFLAVFRDVSLISKMAMPLLILALIFGLHSILWSDCGRDIKAHITLIKELNTMAARQSPPHSKWFIRMKNIPCTDPMLDPYFFSESMVFSTMDGQKPIVHVVVAADSVLSILSSAPPDDICMSYGLKYDFKQIGSRYYPLIPGPYQELLLDSASAARIRSIAR